ncbi:MAG: PmoA family protein [Algoriphagus sp.]|nr:PmoA family protein [Algoriphagus sp.]
MFQKIKAVAVSSLIFMTFQACSGNKEVSSDTSDFQKPIVKLVRKDADKKVEVLIDGQLFTAYYYPETIAKPVLYPIRSLGGADLTRGFPLEPRPGERVDHPHHIGHWFNYGDVNGLDFWNNSDAIPEDKKNSYGTIIPSEEIELKEIGDKAELTVGMDWIGPDGRILLKEKTTFVFTVAEGKRMIDRITTLTAQKKEVFMKDNKEGMLGIRVARELEHPSDKPELFTDANGIATAVPTLNNAGVTGKYRSSEGLEGDAVWGTRGKWTKLSGEINHEKVSLAILDHPKNVGYPTYWHARGYGLFAANPLGQKALSNGKEELNYKLAPGASVTFRYRILVFSGTEVTDQVLNQDFSEFSKK